MILDRMENLKKYKSAPIAYLSCMVLLVCPFVSDAATVLRSGGFQSGGGQGAAGGNISITISGFGPAGLGAVEVSGGNISVSGGSISALVPYVFAPGSIYAYPVPYKPSLGHTRIRFDALSQAATIKIYDISGECVKTINKSDSRTYTEWNVKGDNGRDLASGVYFYTVRSGPDRKNGKIMIIR